MSGDCILVPNFPDIDKYIWPWFSGIGTTTIYKRGHLRALGALGALRALRALRAMGSNVINLEIAQKMAKKPEI